MIRAFRYRFYPTTEQASVLYRTFGCVRFVYNRALTARAEAWGQRQERITYAQTSTMLTAWKKEPDTAWLNEVSSVPLQQSLRHLQSAYVAFWEKRARYPRFKSRKHNHDSAEYTRSAFRWQGGRLTLAKMVDPLDIRWSRPLPDGVDPSSVTVSRDVAGRWHVSILVDDPTIQPLPAVSEVVGIDVGLTALATLSTGEKIANPRHERKDRKALARAQRSLSRKVKGSRNRDKARLRVARIHARITDRRKDHLHKLTTRLVRENQTIVIEDLTVRNMVKNHTLARAISDAAWSDMRRMLEYKCAWYGRTLTLVDRWYPSSKLCSECGYLASSMPLGVRKWACQSCGILHDRDLNAARNLVAAGLAATACGEGVRPNRRLSDRLPLSKQETQPATVGTPMAVSVGGMSTA